MPKANFARILLFLMVLTVISGNPFRPYRAISSKIIGGQMAVRGESPYMVAILTSVGSIICGGAIIDESHILTTAHCLESMEDQSTTIVAGISDLCSESSKNVIEGQQTRKIEWSKIHERFSFIKGKEYNIGIIKVKEPFKFNKFVQSVKLPTSQLDTNVHNNCKVTGWGLTKCDGKTRVYYSKPIATTHCSYQTVLACDQRVGNFQTHNAGECNDWYSDKFVPEKMICAGYDGATHGGNGYACWGDEGDPLVFKGELHGILTNNHYICHSAAIFISIHAQLDWINKNMNN